MKSTEVKTLKGAVHFALALAPAMELKQSTSKFRTALLGVAIGWHLQAAFYHWFIEGEDEKNKRGR